MNAAEVIAAFQRREHTIPGNLEFLDVVAIATAGQLQTQHGVRADILEIGVYKGKSAVLLGSLLQTDERLVVCDLFGAPATTDANADELQQYYRDLGRVDFERNYLTFHTDLPIIHQCPSQLLADRLGDQRFRLVHVDGSHLYDAVRADAETARSRLISGGLTVFDDFRAPHAPGVGAAVWEQVATTHLVPLWVTDAKLYGSWEPPSATFIDEFAAAVAAHGIDVERIPIDRHSVLRLIAPRGPLRQRLGRALVPPAVWWAARKVPRRDRVQT